MRGLPRVRKWATSTNIGAVTTQTDGTVSRNLTPLWEWTREELAVSEGHRRSPSGYYLDGGPLFVWNASVRHANQMDLDFTRWGNKIEAHLGGVFPVSSYFSGLVPSPSNVRPSWANERQIAFAHGPAAYRKTRPGNPLVDVGQFVGELHQLPSIPFRSLVRWPTIRSLAGVPFRNWGIALRNRLKEFVRLEGRLGAREFLRRAGRRFRPGGEYLNYAFGWEPFLRDLVSAFELSLGLEKELDKLRRESGKGIHRRTTLKRDTVTEDISIVGNHVPFQFVGGGAFAPGGVGVVGSTSHRAVRTTKERVWFAGKYRYYIPEPTTVLGQLRLPLALYGLLPTPSLAWELTPMSWLLDWFANFGDTISNASANGVDNLVMEYGYICRHVLTTVEATAHVRCEPGSAPGYNDWKRIDHTFSSTYQLETKARNGANPFFPGAQPWVFEPNTRDPFSKRQWAILAALGLSAGFNR